MKRLLFETDWLGSRPVFYNERTARASHNINDVIDFENLEFDPEGFNNFLDFGYSVFEQTPIKNVRFLRYSSRLWEENGELKVEYLPDPMERLLDWRLSETDVLDLLQDKIRSWERSTVGDIVLPTSGGYDSRLLNVMIEDKSRIRSFTYGLSDKQEESFEVTHAKKLSELMGTRWERIPLGDYHRYFDDWHKLYGIATHAHGMYHIEFYTKIKVKVGGGHPFLSGIIGDILSGNWVVPEIKGPQELIQLGKTYGMNASSSASRLRGDQMLKERYFEQNREQLRDAKRRILEAARIKIILLSYLMEVPRSFGFKPWSPFLDIEVAAAMLNLEQDRRNKRLWQRVFFEKQGLDFESMKLTASLQNNLNMQALRRIPVHPLDARRMSPWVDPRYVSWINRQVQRHGHLWDRILHAAEKQPRIQRAFGLQDDRLKAYLAYLTLKPIETVLFQTQHLSEGKN